MKRLMASFTAVLIVAASLLMATPAEAAPRVVSSSAKAAAQYDVKYTLNCKGFNGHFSRGGKLGHGNHWKIYKRGAYRCVAIYGPTPYTKTVSMYTKNGYSSFSAKTSSASVFQGSVALRFKTGGYYTDATVSAGGVRTKLRVHTYHGLQ